MRIWLGAGALVLTAAVVVSVATATGGETGLNRLNRIATPVPGPSTGAAHGPAAGAVKLVAYPSCAQMVAGLRQQTAKNVTTWGISQPAYAMAASGGAAKSSAPAEDAAAPAPDHSTTNVHEAGVDEPDSVKTDGNRIVTVSRGVLRVVDTATRKVTASLTLVDEQQAWGPADLLLHGDRALVILPGGIASKGAPYPMPGQSTSTYVLVDLSGRPKVLGSISPRGSYLDARMVGSTVRLVVRSQPHIMFPQLTGRISEQQQLAHNRSAALRAPIDAWLPSYQVTGADGSSVTHTVPCGQVRHPVDYTGTSMLTIFTIDLSDQAAGFKNTSPISLAADGDTVYASTTSLYVTSNPRAYISGVAIAMPAQGVPNVALPRAATPPILPPRPGKPVAERTEIYRFDISGTGAPRYVASGKVAGRLLNQYSLSDFDGYLRIATTTGTALANEPGQSSASSTSTSSVYVLRSDTLAKVGEVDGLGKHQRIYSVRFIGPVGYVVTFEQMDPLYTLDLRDPTSPRVAGQLELTGYSAYLHPAGDGRMIGIGQDATTQGRRIGLQVSLFDVSDPAHPRRLAHLVKQDYTSGAEFDPHAFLYWPESGTAVLPINTWQDGQYDVGALVLKVADSAITVKATVDHPLMSPNSPQGGITRALMVGNTLWTLSDAGLMASSAGTFARQAWIPLN